MCRSDLLGGAVAAITLLVPLRAHAQDGYRQPPEPIRSILDATLTPRVAVSPDNTLLLLLDRPDGRTDHGVRPSGQSPRSVFHEVKHGVAESSN